MKDNVFGEYVRFRRTNGTDLSLRALAEKAGISAAHLSKIERGISPASYDTVVNLAYALNMDKTELLALAGFVDDEIRYTVAEHFGPVLDTFAEPVVSTPSAPFFVYDPKAAGESYLYEYVAAHWSEDMSDDDAYLLVKEMRAAYELTLKRIKNRKEAADLAPDARTNPR
ncbi:helix-turn-helix domain-containing protein [Paenibacillus sp. P22]|uniref:helix-turn-helix domain-containing protein n=1 Tax=Paenibacillus sp. P22 TaxID=483908 RepID=UPI000430C87E|nr:helix-turn-helix transcriptional regulator [Paenibacillus sp. P22]CDN42026.1 hypothetical protein BN871_AT_00280 [Paenibacillus sp. P22]